jgi:CTP synthase (UTP-ammonia lyase)
MRNPFRRDRRQAGFRDPGESMTRILLVGDYDSTVTAHRGIDESFRLAAAAGLDVSGDWPGTEAVEQGGKDLLARYDGIWCVPASPYRSMAGALHSIRYAREKRRPFLGTCGGFQHAIIDFARNVAGFENAEHEETAPHAALHLVSRLACSLIEVTAPIVLRSGTKAIELAGREQLTEGFHCSFGLNPEYVAVLEKAGLTVSGVDDEGQPRVIELVHHPFFVATLFQPERAALAGQIHPIVLGLFHAARAGRHHARIATPAS